MGQHLREEGEDAGPLLWRSLLIFFPPPHMLAYSGRSEDQQSWCSLSSCLDVAFDRLVCALLSREQFDCVVRNVRPGDANLCKFLIAHV